MYRWMEWYGCESDRVRSAVDSIASIHIHPHPHLSTLKISLTGDLKEENKLKRIQLLLSLHSPLQLCTVGQA